MKIRAFEPKDYDNLRRLHSEYYKEFELPDFGKGFMCAFVIEDDQNHLVCIGGIKTFAESIIITDKSRSLRDRREALYNVLDISSHLAKQSGYLQLHAVTLDEKYAEVLLKRGFERVKGHTLVINI